MAISYPLTPPASPKPRRLSLAPMTAAGIHSSPFTFAQQVQEHQGQLWGLDVVLPPMKRSDAEPWLAMFLKLHGIVGTFLYGDLSSDTPQGIATGTPLVNGASQTGYQLTTDGWTVSQTGILKAGDYIGLGSGSGSQLYKVEDDVDSDGAGNAVLNIWPDLRSSPGDDDPITVSSPRGVFRMREAPSWDIDEALVYSISFSAMEAL